MKVTGFEVFPVVCPPPFRGGRSWLFVRLDTDTGTRGYGEMMLLGVGFRLPVLAAMMADVIEQAVIGHDPYDTEMLFDKVYGRAGYSHYPELTKLGILSAIEMACWDIIGKDCGQPVYKLLGGAMRDRVRTYTYIYDDPAAAPTTPVLVTTGRSAVTCGSTRRTRPRGPGTTWTKASPRSRSTRSPWC